MALRLPRFRVAPDHATRVGERRDVCSQEFSCWRARLATESQQGLARPCAVLLASSARWAVPDDTPQDRTALIVFKNAPLVPPAVVHDHVRKPPTSLPTASRRCGWGMAARVERGMAADAWHVSPVVATRTEFLASTGKLPAHLSPVLYGWNATGSARLARTAESASDQLVDYLATLQKVSRPPGVIIKGESRVNAEVSIDGRQHVFRPIRSLNRGFAVPI